MNLGGSGIEVERDSFVYAACLFICCKKTGSDGQRERLTLGGAIKKYSVGQELLPF